MAVWAPGPALAAYHAGVMVVCELASQFTRETWEAPTPCPEWRAVDLAAHLRCVADDYHEYLDDAPVSRLARLMASCARPERLARKLARQNAAELAALADGTGPEHITAFAASARAYAQRILPAWDLPHHRYRDVLVTAGGMLGAACAEWHLHAWDLARTLGMVYRPADPAVLTAGWQAGMPHLPLGVRLAIATSATGPDAGFLSAPPALDAPGPAAVNVPGPAAMDAPGPSAPDTPGPAAVDLGGAWFVLLRASGRLA